MRCDRRTDDVGLSAVEILRLPGVKNDALPLVVLLCCSVGIPLVLARRLITRGFGVTDTFVAADAVGDSTNAKATLFALRRPPGVLALMMLFGVLATLLHSDILWKLFE